MEYKLRKLKEKDVDFMLEWMHDDEINQYFVFDAKNTTKMQALEFISKSQNLDINANFAIVDSTDEYLGTISLKAIDHKNKNAEYAISLRKKAIGTGAATIATQAIISYAFNDLQLNKVYLNVLSDNIRAIKFYEKSGFIYEGEFKKHIIKNGEFKNLKWFAVYKN